MLPCFVPHTEILPPAQKKLYPELSALKLLGFVLYGGTALSLQYAHRISIDFDFFTHAALNHKMIRDALPLLNDSSRVRQLQDLENTQTFEINYPDVGNVKISFFGTVGFGRVGTPLLTRDGNLLAASKKDIFATKLKTILQRPSTKDYLDIAQLIKSGESLRHALSAASLFFGTNFDPMISLRALSYYEDLMPRLEIKTAQFLTASVHSTMREIEKEGLPVMNLASKTLSIPSTNELIVTSIDKRFIEEMKRRKSKETFLSQRKTGPERGK